ncbi:MAG TPA: EVE domain-containing protein [Vicinamibacterales bacterium]|nr:EVE domain-containing protein [Vicinamibacterales bacterium]
MNWLFKEEPSSYSFEQFTKDGGTSWSGVKNPLAQKHLGGVKKGDRIFYYHTGNEKAVIGIARATSDAYPDPKDKSGKAVVVDIAPVRELDRPVTLAEIKAAKAFATFVLTRLPRLSVMPVTDAEWKEIEKRSREVLK